MKKFIATATLVLCATVGVLAGVVAQASPGARELSAFISGEIISMQTALESAEAANPSDPGSTQECPLSKMATAVKAPFEIGEDNFWFKAGVTITPEVELFFEHQ